MKDFARILNNHRISPQWSAIDPRLNPAFNVFYALADDDTQLYLGYSRDDGYLYALVGYPENDYIRVVSHSLVHTGYDGLTESHNYKPEYFAERIEESIYKLEDLRYSVDYLPSIRKDWLDKTIRDNLDVIHQNIRDSMEGILIASRILTQFWTTDDKIKALIESFPEHQMLAEGYACTTSIPHYLTQMYLLKTEQGVPFVLVKEASGRLYVTSFGSSPPLYLPNPSNYPDNRHVESVILVEPTILRPKRLLALGDKVLYYANINEFNPAFVLHATPELYHPNWPLRRSLRFVMFPFPMKLLYGLAKNTDMRKVIQPRDISVFL